VDLRVFLILERRIYRPSFSEVMLTLDPSRRSGGECDEHRPDQEGIRRKKWNRDPVMAVEIETT
jgi:hypothetical protein